MALDGGAIFEKLHVRDLPALDLGKQGEGRGNLLTGLPAAGMHTRLVATGATGRSLGETIHLVHDQISILDPGYLHAQLIEEEWGWLEEKMHYYRRPLRDITAPVCNENLSSGVFVVKSAKDGV
jgi:hypothetical protein